MATLGDNVTNINQLTLDQNILDGYANYTYNFVLKLYDAELSKANRLPISSDRFVVIAESGVTSAFNIKRVEIQNLPGTTRENKGASTQLINIDLEEPLGFTLIDRLLQAGKDLNLPSLSMGAPYVLELTFVGWDENGVPIKPIMATKTWVLVLQNVIPELKKSGTHYLLKFARQNEQVQQDVRCKINKTIKFTKAKTLVGTLNNFAEALTKASDIASEGTNYTITGSKNDPTRLKHVYKFEVQDSDSQLGKFSSWTMADNTSQNTQRQFEMTPGAGKSTQFEIVIQPGKDIFEVLTAILGNTKEAYKFVCPAADTSQAAFNNSEIPSFFHFETITTNDSFDPTTNAYSQTHIIQIVPKVLPRNNFLTSSPGDEKDVKQLMSENLYIKGYEYLFTGKNTSVLDVNLDFSSAWTDVSPMFLQLLAPHTSSNVAPNTMSVDNTLPYIPVPDNSKVSRSSNQTTPFALSAARPDAPSITNYLEDYPAEGLTIESFARREPDRDYSQYEKISKGYSFAGDEASTAKLSIFGYLADNSYVNLSKGKPGVTSMAKINLIVRGDPFWLGINAEEIDSIYNGADYTTLRKTQRNYAVFQSGEQCLYLKFRPPQAIDENTGLMKFNTSSVFNTLYNATLITSIFENGVFKQDIQASMMRGITATAVQSVSDVLLAQDSPFLPITSPAYDYSNPDNLIKY